MTVTRSPRTEEHQSVSADPPPGFEPMRIDRGFNAHVGPIFIDPSPASPRLGFRVMAHHVNPAGICHGGMLMTVMDMALAVGLMPRLEQRRFLPTVNLTFDFLQPGRLGDWLESRIDFTHATPRTGFAAGLLVGPEGPVLRCNGIVKIPSPDDPRYRIPELEKRL